MKVLYLGVMPFPLTAIIEDSGCNVVVCNENVDIHYIASNKIDFIVSYRCPFIIKQPVIESVSGRIINLHISYLPFNRGADPNLWSFLEDSPKGVTIHFIDCGVDTGDIIAQKKIEFIGVGETLATTYDKLNKEIVDLFREQWPFIMAGRNQRKKQSNRLATTHNVKDMVPFSFLFKEKGWQTPVADLVGRAVRRKIVL